MIRNRLNAIASVARFPALPRLRLALVPATALLLVACASTPPNNPALNEARALYNQAVNDVSTARAAPLELRSAQQALQQAESALQAGDDPSAVDHYAYLARQRAATAMQAGVIARAEASAEVSTADRTRIVMEARTREAEASAREAEARTREAEASNAAAQKARDQALVSRMEAGQQQAAADAARARAAKLQQELAALQAQQTDRGMVLTLGDVLFDTGRAELKAGAFGTVDRLATFLRENPERRVAIEGHTDAVGSDSSNLSLSQRRADAVRAALVSRGIDGTRITAQGMGEAVPVASNDTGEGRQRNRRVEVIIANAS
jgi:outer membrane protein OmpA-like peptidoglycan-associated protein